MAPRRLTTRERIESLMYRLGHAVRQPGRIYFTGGATAVLLGWREMTADVDLEADPEPSDFFAALPMLKEELDLNIELASPAQFIPALPGWRERSPFIARQGQLDFHHYDFYSQALAKLERFHARDLRDVRSMLTGGHIMKPVLLDYFRQIEPELIRFPAIEPTVFAANVQHFLSHDCP